MNNQSCPNCGREMQRGVLPFTLTYKGESVTFDAPGWYCEGCGESIHTGKDMQESDKHLNILKARVENLLLPDEVRRIRKKLSLNQKLAGEILGGGPSAFNKYENGLILPSQAISNLLRILDVNPEVFEVLSVPHHMSPSSTQLLDHTEKVTMGKPRTRHRDTSRSRSRSPSSVK